MLFFYKWCYSNTYVIINRSLYQWSLVHLTIGCLSSRLLKISIKCSIQMRWMISYVLGSILSPLFAYEKIVTWMLKFLGWMRLSNYVGSSWIIISRTLNLGLKSVRTRRWAVRIFGITNVYQLSSKRRWRKQRIWDLDWWCLIT